MREIVVLATMVRMIDGRRDPALDELRELYEAGTLVVFVGAGISAAAGLPSWKRLVEQLVERARQRGGDAAEIAEIEHLAASGRYIDGLTALRDGPLGATEFGAAVERHLDDKGRPLPDAARAIAALGPKLHAVLTTNVDRLLERAFAGDWPAFSRATADVARRRHVILKLHGTLEDRATWVFTRDQYERAMYADPNLKTAFDALFHAHPLLFVGYGLADDDFDAVLGRVRAAAGAQPPRHFALVAAESVRPFKKKQLEAAGVRVIAYENADGTHAELARILRDLAGAAPTTPTATTAPATASTQPSGTAPATTPRAPAGAANTASQKALADAIVTRLSMLLPAQFEEIVFRLRIPTQFLSSSSAPQAMRAVEVVRYLESEGRLDEAARLVRLPPHS